MLDAKRLLEQFMGSSAAGSAGTTLQGAGDTARRALDKASSVTPGGMAGVAAAGGVLALLLGSKKVRKAAGGVVGLGGAAALGALAYRAFQNHRAGTAVPPSAAAPAPQAALPAPFQPDAPAAGGEPFGLTLVRAMIAAAKADGHIDAAEQQRIFEAVERMELDAEAKGFVFDAMRAPADPAAIAASAATQEQAAQLYLASRMAIDLDHAAERAWLEALTHRLNLAPELVAQLDRQIPT